MENEDNEFAELINVLRQQISKIFVHWVDSSWFFSNSVELWKYIICTLHKSILIVIVVMEIQKLVCELFMTNQ